MESIAGAQNEIFAGRKPDRTINYLSEGKPLELQRPTDFTYVAQGKAKDSDSTALTGDGMGFCMAMLEKGEGILTTLVHVEGGGIDGSVQRFVEKHAAEQNRPRALILRATDSYGSRQLEEQMQRMGVLVETISVDVGKHHFAVAYRPTTGEVIFDDELRSKAYVFNWK